MRIALFYTAGCYSAHAFQGYQDGTLRLFWEMASCSLALCAALARVFTLWRNNRRERWIFMWTAILCALGEILPLHTHLQWAHLLIRPDPGDWLAPLFRAQAAEICLSFKWAFKFTHTLHANTGAQTHIFIMPLLRLIGGLLCDVDVGPTQCNPSSRL